MIKPLRILTLLILTSWLVSGQYKPSFIANEGQWSNPFDYKFDMGSGAIFLQGSSLVITMADESALADLHRVMHGEDTEVPGLIQAHAYEVKLVGASAKIASSAKGKSGTKYNYFLGVDSKRWKSGVGAYSEVLYTDVYPGIDAKYYFTPEGNLKYDFVVDPKVDPSHIVMQYIGVEEMELSEGNLNLGTSLGNVIELAPFAYQIIDGQRVRVECSYHLEGDFVKFKLGAYNKRYSLVIDPELVFSTFSGSTANNFGFTATYSEDGGLYAGGIVFNDGGAYPATRGAYQINFSGPRIDVAISKFSSDGSTLEYATYLGGDEDEVPYSLVETHDKNLVIYGSTGSDDFPTRHNAYDRTFNTGGGDIGFFRDQVMYPSGSDVFVCVLDSTGGSLPASTLYGGSGLDGFNSFVYNYGDDFRGEVIVDSVGNIYVVGGSQSANLTVGTSAWLRQAPDTVAVNGFVASFDADLSNLRWASYLGGAARDNALSIKMSPDNQSVYIAGTTLSDDLGLPSEAYQNSRISLEEGYIVNLKASDGQFLYGTYNGTFERDVNYFVDIDDAGDVYVIGQTRGDYPITTDSNLFQVAGSSQYIHKLSSDLSRSKSAMVFGDGTHARSNVSPTAFMVDECRNVYVSGWGGGVNQGSLGQGWTRNMPITSDAYQSTTDGSDFYFMVLDASWKEITYATYFGGINHDHVDGGTSRFSPDGTIYQAVCGGCFGNSNWPTTSNSYSRYNLGGAGSCNLAAIKMSFEAMQVKAKAVPDVDTACVPFSVKVKNESYNGDVYQWILPDGNIVNGDLDSLYITTYGKHIYTLIAKDTMCNTIDTAMMPIYAFGDSIQSAMEAVYDSCDNILKVNFVNHSTNAVSFQWDFGDGVKSTEKDPVHTYLDGGEYMVTLISKNKPCGVSDTSKIDLSLLKRVNSNDFVINYEPCRDKGVVQLTALGTYFQEYNWDFGDGESYAGKKVTHSFKESGKYTVSLSLKDTICQRYFTKDTVLEVFSDGFTPWMPNIFTPNGDGLNDYFGVPNTAHPEFFPVVDMKIFNRWGKLLYETNDIAQPWDGTFESNTLAEGVYFYILEIEDACSNQKELKGFVHLMNQ